MFDGSKIHSPTVCPSAGFPSLMMFQFTDKFQLYFDRERLGGHEAPGKVLPNLQ